MKIRSSVFGSASERLLYKALQTRWSDQLNVFPNLPFANIIDLQAATLPSNERRYLLTTSLDYTLCDKSDHPLLSIEFDGLGEGFSRDGVYVPRYTWAKDPNRQWKMNFKLNVCESAWYPLFIVSLEETRQLGSDVSLSVIDAIIGHALAGMHTQARVDELAQDQREVINNWPPDDPSFDEFLSDLVIEAEVEMQMAWNPVRRKINEFQDHLMRHDRKLSWSPRLLSMPEEHRTDYRQENSRIRAGTFGASGSVEQVGNQVSVHTSKGDVTEIAWIRTVPDWLTASIIGDEIAQLLAFKRAAGLFDDPLRRSA